MQIRLTPKNEAALKVLAEKFRRSIAAEANLAIEVAIARGPVVLKAKKTGR